MMNYKFRMLCIAITILLSNAFTNYSYGQCNLTDWETLRTLYVSTYGANWTNNTGWDQVDPAINPSSPPAACDLGTMYGITLDASGAVNEINLSNNNLTGIIPLEVGDLVDVTSLNLKNILLSSNLCAKFNAFATSA